MDQGGSVARCRLIAVLTVWISRSANPSGSRIEGYWWREEMWGVTPRRAIMRVSGPETLAIPAAYGHSPHSDRTHKTGEPGRSGAPLLYPAERLDYSSFRSPVIFVAEVTGGAIMICGPCTVGS